MQNYFDFVKPGVADIIPERRDVVVNLFELSTETPGVQYKGLRGLDLGEAAAIELELRADPEAEVMMDAVRAARYRQVLAEDAPLDDILIGLMRLTDDWSRPKGERPDHAVERMVVAHEIAVEERGFYELSDEETVNLEPLDKAVLAEMTCKMLEVTEAYGDAEDVEAGLGQVSRLLGELVNEDPAYYGPWAFTTLNKTFTSHDRTLEDIMVKDEARHVLEKLAGCIEAKDPLLRLISVSALAQLRQVDPDSKRYKRIANRLLSKRAIDSLKGRTSDSPYAEQEERTLEVATDGLLLGPRTLQRTLRMLVSLERTKQATSDQLQEAESFR